MLITGFAAPSNVERRWHSPRELCRRAVPAREGSTRSWLNDHEDKEQAPRSRHSELSLNPHSKPSFKTYREGVKNVSRDKHGLSRGSAKTGTTTERRFRNRLPIRRARLVCV